jgi:hypothetical protein
LLDSDIRAATDTAQRLPDPVAVGAVGGSGTRLVANMLRGAGIAMGTPVNTAGDAAEWPPLKKLLAAPGGRSRHDVICAALEAFETLLLYRRDALGLSGRAGWKVPGTFHWLAEFNAWFPAFQYVHLIRNGLDMAYSGNRSPVENWAAHYGVELRYCEERGVHPHSMLEYWLAANERALATGRALLGERFLLLRFEHLCESPREAVEQLFAFLGVDMAPAAVDEMASLVKPPGSVGRYRERDWRADFSEAQLARLEALGYSP